MAANGKRRGSASLAALGLQISDDARSRLRALPNQPVSMHGPRGGASDKEIEEQRKREESHKEAKRKLDEWDEQHPNQPERQSGSSRPQIQPRRQRPAPPAPPAPPPSSQPLSEVLSYHHFRTAAEFKPSDHNYLEQMESVDKNVGNAVFAADATKGSFMWSQAYNSVELRKNQEIDREVHMGPPPPPLDDSKARYNWCTPRKWESTFLKKHVLHAEETASFQDIVASIASTKPLQKDPTTGKYREHSLFNPMSEFGLGRLSFKVVSSGTYNVVFAPDVTDEKGTIDPKKLENFNKLSGDDYPPQLNDVGHDKYVIRMTRINPADRIPFPSEEMANRELKYTLLAASAGFAPDVFACVVIKTGIQQCFPNEPAKAKPQNCCILIMVTKKMSIDLDRLPFALLGTPKSTDANHLLKQFQASSIPLETTQIDKKLKFVDSLAKSFLKALSKMSRHKSVAFDLKPGNIVVDSSTKTVLLVDFDPVHFKRVDENGSVDGVLLANMLNSLTHIRTYTPAWFSNQFVATLRPFLCELLSIVVEQRITPGSKTDLWIVQAQFPNDQHRMFQTVQAGNTQLPAYLLVFPEETKKQILMKLFMGMFFYYVFKATGNGTEMARMGLMTDHGTIIPPAIPKWSLMTHMFRYVVLWQRPTLPPSDDAIYNVFDKITRMYQRLREEELHRTKTSRHPK